jgi:hypothetical protein
MGRFCGEQTAISIRLTPPFYQGGLCFMVRYESSTKNIKDTNMSDTPSSASLLREEYEKMKSLFAAQPGIVQRFLEAQARQIAEALIEHMPQVRFSLPDRVIGEVAKLGESAPMSVPQNAREQIVGGLKYRLFNRDVRSELRHRLNELEQSPDLAVSISTSLIRYATVLHMVHNMLPSGRSVIFSAEEGEEIPTIPQASDLEPESAITATTDAIAEEGKTDEGRGELLVPYVPAARKFFLPQWVAFDEKDNLLVGSIEEAQAHIASMQRFVTILHSAIAISSYIVADDNYQKKRYGILGQLINQGRALSRYQTREIIRKIKERAVAHNLNRGLSLSLPYFDDQELKINISHFEVIPAGRIMFVPAFLVRASREEQAKVAQDTRLNPSTRKHLLIELQMLEEAFKLSEEIY